MNNTYWIYFTVDNIVMLFKSNNKYEQNSFNMHWVFDASSLTGDNTVWWRTNIVFLYNKINNNYRTICNFTWLVDIQMNSKSTESNTVGNQTIRADSSAKLRVKYIGSKVLAWEKSQELIMEMRYPNVTWRIILPVYLFTMELRHTCSSLIFF